MSGLINFSASSTDFIPRVTKSFAKAVETPHRPDISFIKFSEPDGGVLVIIIPFYLSVIIVPYSFSLNAKTGG